MKERVNLMKSYVEMRMFKGNRKSKLSKKVGALNAMEILVICAIVFIIGALLKEPISNLATTIMTEISRIAKGWFTGL